MTTFDTGRRAEVAGAEYLIGLGYKILEQNWRTRYCEIDVIALQGNTVHFVEVKYRRSSQQGYGIDYVTPKKLQQMGFAAEMWVQSEQWQGEYVLAALEVSGIDFVVTSYIEAI